MKILSVCSARPNFVKLAAIHHALKGQKDIEHVIVHTGQHYDPLLSDVFFTQLEIPQPDFNLGVKGGEDRHAVIQATADAMHNVLENVKPDIVLVYGDVNGAVGAARAAKKLGIKLGHVEAGLRSFDETMPEEHNRIEIDRLADVLFVSEQAGLDNLRKEQSPGNAILVGNTMIDTLMGRHSHLAEMLESMKEALAELTSGHYALATIHRPSNVDHPETLAEVMKFLQQIGEKCPVVLPLHPRLKHALEKIGPEQFAHANFLFTEPIPYLEFHNWMYHAAFIVTDSGGIQEEATFLKKRCFTLRRNTERPSTIEAGSNVLIDPDKEEDRQQVFNFAKNPHPINVTIPPMWDGKTGERILKELQTFLPAK